jgi:L-threonylcarbamoyladenylate synthase
MAVVYVDPEHPDPAMITRAAELLRAGRLVVFPTETVYGLGANALDPAAVALIFAAKGRPAYNPLIVHLAESTQVSVVAAGWNDNAERLARVFWPGPLTLVLPKTDAVPETVTAGLSTVAVRVPRHPVAHALLSAAGIPVAAPSANRSTQLSPTTGEHVVRSLGDAADLILDAGPTPVGIESTVVDVTTPVPTLLRPGSITLDDLARVVGRIDRHGPAVKGESARPAPGMLDKHYAPRAKVVLVAPVDVGVRVEHERANGLRVGALVVHASVEPTPEIITMPADPVGYAAALYASLHALDDAACDVIVVERLPETNAWLAVRDRLTRAAY